tara:strand:+ start:644 stop:1306 length:663 start_codon:yes stop_codon:yes gene_type:complete
MKQLFESWRRYTEEAEAETTIATSEGEIPIDEELLNYLMTLAAEDPEAMKALLQKLQQAQATSTSEGDALEEWNSICEGANLDTGLMSKLGKWAKGVGLAAAMAGLSAISAGSAQAAHPPDAPLQSITTGYAQGSKLGYVLAKAGVDEVKKYIASNPKRFSQEVTNPNKIGIKSFKKDPRDGGKTLDVGGHIITFRGLDGTTHVAYNLDALDAGVDVYEE